MSAHQQAVAQDPASRRAIGALLVVTLCGGFAFLVSSGWTQLFPPSVFDARMDPDCDLRHGPCGAEFADGRSITLELEPKTIAPMEPLALTLRFDGIRTDEISIVFEGVKMNMGQVPADIIEQHGDTLTATTILPVCVRRRMDWRASVQANDERGIYRAAYRFAMVGRQP